MNFAVSVIHNVSDLTGAAEFMCNVLGFQQKEIQPDAIIVENGAITVRLVTLSKNPISNALTIEFQTQDIAATVSNLLAHNGIRLPQQDNNVNRPERVETLLLAPYGLSVMVVQEFNEDELGLLPPLPTSLIWDETAESLVKRMLKLVPVGFRQAARIRVTERAEMLAGEEASITVTLDKAVQALVQTTPLFQQPALLASLEKEGITPSSYHMETAP